MKELLGPEKTLEFSLLSVVIAGTVTYFYMRRSGASRSSQLAVGLLMLLLLSSVYILRANPEEAFHFLEYGLLSGFANLAIRRSPPRGRDFVFAGILAGFIGIVEEGFQGILPGRYFDPRDIRFNIEASIVVQIVLFAVVFSERQRSR